MTEAEQCLIVGHATIDEIWKWDASDPTLVTGGAAVYATCGAVLAGGDVRLVTIVGSDYDFDPLMHSAGGHIELAVERRLGESIRNKCWYETPEERRWEILNWSTMVEMSPGEDKVAPFLDQASALVVCPTPVAVAAGTVDLARSHCAIIVLDTEVHYLSGIEERRELLSTASGGVYFAPSWAHLPLLLGNAALVPGGDLEPTVFDACLEYDVRHFVAKRGEFGCVVVDVHKRRWWEVPAVRSVDLIDPTGAGDAFDGGFAVALARSGDPVEAACWGAVSASFMVEHRGGTVPSHFTPSLARDRLVEVRSGLMTRDFGGAVSRSRGKEPLGR